jgi:hypothetical protein
MMDFRESPRYALPTLTLLTTRTIKQFTWDRATRLSGAIGATREALIAAFCRREKSLSCCREKGWLVGAVGIEPTTFGLKGRCSTTELRP